MNLWRLRDVTLAYPELPAPALDGVTLDVPAGRWTAVIGPNGAGKSSLLNVVLGTERPSAGAVEFQGRSLREWSRRALARAIGVVPQSEETPPALTVRELVAMGRYPHLGPLTREGPTDRAAIEEALETCDVAPLRDRAVGSLSGGERQRARIARALAQEPATLVLDEPTAALDVRHEMAVFELLRALASAGKTVLLVTHNVNLAARYADDVVLLHRGHVRATGAPADVLNRELLEDVYDWPLAVGRHEGPGRDVGAPQLVPLAPAEAVRAGGVGAH